MLQLACRLSLLAPSLLLAGLSPAQADWEQLATATPRSDHVTVDDGSRLLTFGGDLVGNGGGASNDTLAWNGRSWTLLQPTTRPGRRLRHAGAYDVRRRRFVIFGGRNSAGTLLADTWLFDGRNWTQMRVSGPSAREDHAMAYDPLRGRVILFGGKAIENSAPVVRKDTWEWSGTQWTKLSPKTVPPERRDFPMATDVHRRVIVMHGGFPKPTSLAGPLQDTWEWDGRLGDWVQRAKTGPEPRGGHALAYDVVRQRTVLSSGFAFIQNRYVSAPDTWEWEGTQWTKRTTKATPSGRSGHTLAYDTERRQVVQFAGYTTRMMGDTWQYSYAFGQSCPGPAGHPLLTVEVPPRIGADFVLRIANLPRNAAVGLILGVQPIRGRIGPCFFYVNPIVVGGFATGNGDVRAKLPIPNLSGLNGGVLLDQAFLIGPIGSNAVRGAIGVR